MGLCKKTIDDPSNKKIFCWVACFLIFSKKNQKTGDPTSFYFAAEGGEIPLTKPRRHLRLYAVQK